MSIFDLYSLVAQRHPLTLPAELMHIFLQQVNLEIEVAGNDFEEAADVADCHRAMFYLGGATPTILPFASNLSLNSYAGINDRSSGNQARMHQGLREGITHDTARIATWPHELSFSCIRGPTERVSFELTPGQIAAAAARYEQWRTMEATYPHLRAARRSLVKAPLMPDVGSSILQIWQGLEGLFPSISTEITFRISLLLAELAGPFVDRAETYTNSKMSYADRSRIAHGSPARLDGDKWFRAWSLLCDVLRAVLKRGKLPTEDELTREILSTR